MPSKLLRRHVGRGAVGQPELLLHQVGQLVVLRQPEIDQHGFARGAEHDVARLDVEMDDMLAVQVVERGRDLPADLGDLIVGQRQFAKPAVERLARRWRSITM